MLLIAFIFYSLLQWYSNWSLLSYILTEESFTWDLSLVFLGFQLLFIPFATYLFSIKHKIGWHSLNFLIVYTIGSVIGLTIMTWNYEPLGNEFLDNLFPKQSIINSLISVAFYGGVLWGMIQNDVIQKFNIEKQKAIQNIVVSAIIVSSYIYAFL